MSKSKLMSCRDCEKEISKKAKVCPHCGAKNKKKTGLASWVVLGLIVWFFVASYNKGNEIRTNALNNTAPINSASSASADNTWSYSHSEDPMSSKVTHTAGIPSTNTVNFKFPYAGPQHAELVLRTHPKHGKDVIFSIQQGQLLCNDYDGCSVSVRFDDGEAVTYRASSAADHSTETIFLSNYSGFVERMMKAKRVRIAVNVYQEGVPVFEFDVSRFDKDQYLQTASKAQ